MLYWEVRLKEWSSGHLVRCWWFVILNATLLTDFPREHAKAAGVALVVLKARVR